MFILCSVVVNCLLYCSLCVLYKVTRLNHAFTIIIIFVFLLYRTLPIILCTLPIIAK